MKCDMCESEFESSQEKLYCSNKCKQKAQYQRKKDYNASSIQIRESSNDVWSSAIALSDKYRKNVDFIQRGLMACSLAGVGFDYFINRYLEGDDSIPMNEEVNIISRELQREDRDKRWK